MGIKSIVVATLALTCARAFGGHAQQVDQLVKPLIDAKEIVGCVVGVLDDGAQEIHGYGEIQRGSGNAPDGNTIYEIGSMTKALTGTVLGDMVNHGRMKLDTPVQDLLPTDVKLHLHKDEPITIVDLASQSSGLPRMPNNFTPKDWKNPYVDYTPDKLFEFLRAYQIEHAPGKYEYSNLGVGLLGYLLSKQANKPYEQLVLDTICDPLKMTDTRIKLSPGQQKRLAPPYNADLDGVHNWEFDALAGAGAFRSTANDLLKLAAATLRKDDDPVAKAVHTAWTPHYGKPGEIRVGLCWHLARDNNTWWHNGQTAGYSSALFINPPTRKAVVVLCNTAAEHTTLLAEKILQATIGMKPEPIAVRKVVEVAPEVLKSYEGTYALSLVFAITISVQDSKLMAQCTGQQKLPVYPSSDSEFFYKAVDAKLSFEKGDDGNVNKLVLHQNGKDMPGIKVPGTGSQN